MNKANSKSGSPLFGQLLSYIDRQGFNRFVKETGHDAYVKKLKAWDHFATMLFAVIIQPSGLRELSSGLAAYTTRLKHLGLSHIPKRSTLSDANKSRSPELFEHVFKSVVTHYQRFLSDSKLKQHELWLKDLFLVDASTNTLFKDIMKACGRPQANGKKKGGVKMHVGMKLLENVASLVRITSAATNDKTFMDTLGLQPPKTILVFDKAYVNFKLYTEWLSREITFITRQHRQTIFELSELRPISEKNKLAGVIADQAGLLGKGEYNLTCRRVIFWDEQKNKEFQFVTTNWELDAWQIAEAYKKRWAIELLFKRLKQNVNVQSFYGDNENAIRIQIWCALIADILIMTARKAHLKAKMAYSTAAGLIKMHLMRYVLIQKLLNQPTDPQIFGHKELPDYDLFNPPP